MRVLGLDYGSKRVGVAVSDELRTIALPLEYLDAEPEDQLMARLKQVIEEKGVDQLVVGLPRNMDGSYGPAADLVRQFAARLEHALSLPIRLWDERLTSVQANRLLTEAKVRGAQRKASVDKMAAALLLQSYLDSQI